MINLMHPRILVVEDLPEARVLLKHFVHKQYDVETVPGIDTALKVASEQDFDLFLLDINLGGGDSGIELLGLLRAQPRYRDTPALAVTVHGMSWETELFEEAGFNGFVTKPFRQQELLDAIAKVLSSSTP